MMENNLHDETEIDMIDKEVFRLKRSYHEMLLTESEVSHTKSQRKSKSKSSSSKRLSISERLITELKLDVVYIHKQKEHELESARLENELKIAKAEAKMKIYEGYEGEKEDNLEGIATGKDDYVKEYVLLQKKNLLVTRKRYMTTSLFHSLSLPKQITLLNFH